MDDIALKVEHVSKTFKLPHEKSDSVKGAFVNILHPGRTYETQQVLNDVSFEVKKGDFFGIVGRNGSGKSTLLKMLAGIYKPTNGQIHVNGKLTPFIELGVGFNPELTGRENVFLNGALLGFNRKEMAAMYDEIVEFAELERFMDQKLKNYSSGMQVRLAFSIAIKAKNEILIFDEVLAVGDEAFQRKCLGVFEKYKAEKQTVILVTHEMETVKRFCSRAMLVHDGEIKHIGSPFEVADRYSELNQSDAKRNRSDQNRGSQLSIDTLDNKGKQRSRFNYGETASFSFYWPKSIAAKNANILVFKSTGEYVFGTSTFDQKSGLIEGNRISFELDLNLNAGDYRIEAGLFGEDRKQLLDYNSEGPEFIISKIEGPKWSGLTNLKHSWK